MTQNEERALDDFEMTPELSAFEAKLGDYRPTVHSEQKERVRMEILLAECHRIEKTLTPEARRERLLETIHSAEKEEISFTLKQYVRQVRTASSLTGGVTGFFIGVLLTFIGILLSVHVLARTQPVAQPISDRSARDLNRYLQAPNLLPPLPLEEK